ncbi:hypothetical protein D0Z07_7499 [Hyphodiscus hymeniophilus]|uniref:Thymidylate kinase protein n=1 Tax=Hyphodiscus hymeniophilus TaxID=353542 RepID=A0A9P6VEN1_9HELO|nr:hypothetical protein D0Z07_7499 [Hyphodiscus hymeniophilus]
MATTMAAARQPFAPLNGSRLQNLTNLKNRQNAISTLSPPNKRKASTLSFDNNDAENLDPSLFLSPKKLKSPDGSSVDTVQKPTNFFLTKAPPSPHDFSTPKSINSTPRRPVLPARSPAPRLNTSSVSKTPLTAPAGRSPTRKRIGLLNRRKTASPFTRVDPPKFSTSSGGLGFSIDAALSGTIPSYAKRQASPRDALPVSLHEPSTKDSWFFEIHEDTEEELATNLMEHSTCTLDISSDEESARRLKDERGKENVPPLDDISQTRTSALVGDVETSEASMVQLKESVRARRRRDVDACDVDRCPLGEMNAEEFYAEGCDGSSVFLIPAESDPVVEGAEPTDVEAIEEEVVGAIPTTFDFIAEAKGKGKEIDVDALMTKDDFVVASKASLLEPIEKAEEGFEVWESGSAKGDE